MRVAIAVSDEKNAADQASALERTDADGLRAADAGTARYAPFAQESSAAALRYGPGGGVYRILTTAAESGNTMFVFEAIEPPGGGPPLHVHQREEEFFLVIEGEVTFWVDGQTIQRTAGETAFVPRGAAHCFKNCSDREARLLVLFTPGQIEGFFDYGLPRADGSIPSDEELVQRIVALGPRFGLDVLGPSPL